MKSEATNLPVNPLVRLIKIKRGYKEPVKIVDNHIEFTLQLILYGNGDKFFNQEKVLDHTPLVLVLSIVEDKTRYELFPLPKKSKIVGLYGLDLNLLFCTDKNNNEVLHKYKVKILTLYHLYIAPSIETTIKNSILKELKEILLEIFLIDATKKVFYQSPFFTYQYKYILFSETLKNDKEINGYKKFIPTLELSDTNSESIPRTNNPEK